MQVQCDEAGKGLFSKATNPGYIRNPLRCAFIVGLGVFYLAIPNARPDLTRFSTDDSQFYQLLAHNMLHGRGYTVAVPPDPPRGHKVWPPGVPVLLIPSMLLNGGELSYLYAKWTISLIGLGGVVLAWLLVRRYTASLGTADVAAALLGLNAVYWDFSHQTMSELPLTVWTILGLLLVDIVWRRPEPRRWVVLAVGMICGLGMLIRGHAGALVLAPLAYRFMPSAAPMPRRVFAVTWVLFCLGFSLPTLAWSVRNSTVTASGYDNVNQLRMILQKNDLDPNSRLVTPREFVDGLWVKIKWYAIYRFPEQSIPGLWAADLMGAKWGLFPVLLLTPLIVGVSLVGLRHNAPLHAAIWPMVLLNLAKGNGGAARYWIPTACLMLLALAIGGSRVLALRRPVLAKAISAVLIVASIVSLGTYVHRHERNPYFTQKWAFDHLVVLYERMARKKFSAIAVRAAPGFPNAPFLMFITHVPSPEMPEGVVDHVIGDARPCPPAWRELDRSGPWRLMALPRPMRNFEIDEAWQQAPAAPPSRQAEGIR